MKFKLDILGSIKKDIDADIKKIEKAAMDAAREVGEGLKREWKDQVTGAGLGNKLANTVKFKVYPRSSASMNAAVFVYTKAPEIMRSFDLALTIQGKQSRYIAVPTKFAPVKGNVYEARSRTGGVQKIRSRISPANWPSSKYGVLEFVPAKNGHPAMLVVADLRRSTGKLKNQRGKQYKMASAKWMKDRNKTRSVPMFILVPKVKMPKKLNIEELVKKWQDKHLQIYDDYLNRAGI